MSSPPQCRSALPTGISMPASISLIELAAVTPDGRPLFSNLNLQFGPERTGLVGRNGVGKTTLLRLIAGEQVPSRGRTVRAGQIGVPRQAVQPGNDRLADLPQGSESCRERWWPDGEIQGVDL